MANVNDTLESIREGIWKYTGYKGNDIDILFENSDLNLYIAVYVGGEEGQVPDEYADACYFVAIRPELQTIQIREYRISAPTMTVLM